MPELPEQWHFQLGGNPVHYPKKTSRRVERFFDELKKKRDYSNFTRFTSNANEMIIINGIKVFSFCEHHLLPFFGFASIGYIPHGRILGLSKFQRLVDKVASKPTLQENITEEIADLLFQYIKPKGIGVALSCVHTCMYGRGINTSTCSVNTQVLKGTISNENARHEFLERIKLENIFR